MATNQQRREAAKRKLERQLEHRAERVKRNRVIGVGATVGVVVLVVGVIVFLATRGEEAPASADGANKASDQPRNVCEYTEGGEPAKEVKPPEDGEVPDSGTVDVTFASTAGDIEMTLDREKAPCTVNSMVSLIEQGYYDGTSCHRLGTEGLQMLQCGDPTGTGSGGPGYTVPDEFPETAEYQRGTVAMANTGQPNSGGGQFFMVYGEAQLPPQYTVFGQISEKGLKVLDKVAKAGIGKPGAAGDGTGEPKLAVKFKKVTVNA